MSCAKGNETGKREYACLIKRYNMIKKGQTKGTYNGISFEIHRHPDNKLRWYYIVDGVSYINKHTHSKGSAEYLAEMVIDNMLKQKDNSFIASTDLEDTGGGTYSDVIRLKNGYIVRINELGVRVYANQEADDNNDPQEVAYYTG